MFPDVRARHPRVFLVLPIDHFHHSLRKQAGLVCGEQRLPLFTPNHFDHIPTCAFENGFQFLDHLAISADRAIQTLQIAVDHKNKIVEFLT